MNAFTALLALAGTAGVGYLVYKKVNEKKESEPEVYTEYTEKTGNGGKLHRASMYAVGTIKTTADKISEGIKQVKSEDMVKKGEVTMQQLKETTNGLKSQMKESTDNLRSEFKNTTDNIKDELKEIKNLVTSINKNPSEVSANSKKSDENTVENADAPAGDIPEAEEPDDESSLFEEIEIVDQL